MASYSGLTIYRLCVLGRSYNIAGPQFSHLYNISDSSNPLWWFCMLSKLIHDEHSGV